MRQVRNCPPPTFVNWKQQMLLATDEIGIRDQIIRERFYSDDSIVVEGATKKEIMGQLYRTSFGQIEIEPLCDVKHSPGLKFFQFHFTYYEDELLHRVIGWSHPLLIDRLKQRHCSISLMQHSDVYQLIWYVLTSGKTSQIYEHIFHYICVASKKRLDPAHIVCDFEFAMIKADRDQFPDSRIAGCLFHFKQALRRKMLKLKITEEEVALAMREGCIDGLTLIRRCDIVFKGIPNVRRMIKRDCRDQRHRQSDHNPLERYNRTLNDAFSVPHPDVVQFISVVEKQSRDNVRLINDISNRRARAPSHASPQRAPRFESDYQVEVESESDLADSDDLNSDDDPTSIFSGCGVLAHMAHAAARSACGMSDKKVKKLELCKTKTESAATKLQNYSSARFLSLTNAIRRILDKWPALEDWYRERRRKAIRDKKSPVAFPLAGVETSLVHLLSVLQPLAKLKRSCQAESPTQVYVLMQLYTVRMFDLNSEKTILHYLSTEKNPR
ncbi:Hypothetical protein PHPALM_524 [Phytophthora palmivora]|uniref:MULE transposase domain-containing protein n=1 Tax=Phytophthora palmivora TaxID=4796 RepID=A0A2P4YUN2_9STRA|nr:Hypothetical protein PHPALM_524 [Phytophthora palmivora]